MSSFFGRTATRVKGVPSSYKLIPSLPSRNNNTSIMHNLSTEIPSSEKVFRRHRLNPAKITYGLMMKNKSSYVIRANTETAHKMEN